MNRVSFVDVLGVSRMHAVTETCKFRNTGQWINERVLYVPNECIQRIWNSSRMQLATETNELRTARQLLDEKSGF